MPTPGQELASLDFESMLGGPLVAVVNAQAQAAVSTVNFIKEVGFKKKAEEDAGADTGTEDPIYVSFKYPKELSPFVPAVAAIPADPGDPQQIRRARRGRPCRQFPRFLRCSKRNNLTFRS